MEYNWDDDKVEDGLGGDGWGQSAAVGLQSAQTYNSYAPKKFHLSLFVHALIGAVIGAAISTAIYGTMYNPSGSNVLMVGIILGVMAACILMACAICEIRRPRLTVDKEMTPQRLAGMLLGAVAIFAIGCGLEFLYELGSAYTPVVFNDFIFAIDDSGSMASTDPQNMRYQALAQLLESMDEDKRAGLIRFTDEIYAEPVPMDYLTDAQKGAITGAIENYRSDGGTNISLALEKALDLAQQSYVAGRAPVVVLLSDGGSPVSVSHTAAQFLDAGVAISTVSLGNGADEHLLQQLAQATGGQYFKVDQADDLVEAFQQVSTAVSYRCLFTARPGTQRGNVLYMLLRVVFLMVPGLAISVVLITMMEGTNMDGQVIVSGITGLLAGLLMEVGTYFFWPGGIVRFLSWVLYGIVLLKYLDVKGGVGQSGVQGMDFDDGTGNAFHHVLEQIDQRGASFGKGGNAQKDKRINDWH